MRAERVAPGATIRSEARSGVEAAGAAQEQTQCALGTRHQRRYGPACQRFLLPELTEQSPLTQPFRTKASQWLKVKQRDYRVDERGWDSRNKS